MKNFKISIGFLVILVVGLSASCGLLDQTQDANKLVGEANVLIAQDNKKMLELNNLFGELLGANLITVKDLEVYKKTNQARFDQLTAMSGELEKSGDDTSAKFEQASKFKLNEKYKQYLELKAQEHKKRTDAVRLVAPLVKNFLETKDVNEINRQLDEFNKKSGAFDDEARALMNESDKIVRENPTLIR